MYLLMQLGSINIPCGCEQRKEIMGAGEWKNDALVLAVAVVVILCVIGVKELR